MTAGIIALAVPLVVVVYYKGVLPIKYQSFIDSNIDSTIPALAEDSNDSQEIEPAKSVNT
jgi:uncharacterized membrane protein